MPTTGRTELHVCMQQQGRTWIEMQITVSVLMKYPFAWGPATLCTATFYFRCADTSQFAACTICSCLLLSCMVSEDCILNNPNGAVCVQVLLCTYTPTYVSRK